MVPTFRDSVKLASEFDADVAKEFAIDDREAPDDKDLLVPEVWLGNELWLGEVLTGLVVLAGTVAGGPLWVEP